MKTFRFEKKISLTVILRFCYRANKQRFEQFIQNFNNELYEIEQNAFDGLFEQDSRQHLYNINF